MRTRFRKKLATREFGFGSTDVRQRRLINPDGSYNYVRIGLPFYRTFNFYQFLVSSPWWKFMTFVFGWYTVVNLLFVAFYYLPFVEPLGGMIYADEWEKFWEITFFSSQTLTTVGYGRINPVGFWGSLIASFEALIGLLSFALITGLLYARFSKAPELLLFTEKAVIAPFSWNGKDVPGFMFRTANLYNTNLMNMRASISLSMTEVDENDVPSRRFYSLALERDTIGFFPSSWTVVHPIDENSPLFGLDYEGFKKANPEFMILLSGFDETFDQNIFVRHSYSMEEIEWGAKFIKIFGIDTEGYPTVDLGKLNEFEKRPVDHLIPQTLELTEGDEADA